MFGNTLLIEPKKKNDLTCVCCNCKRSRTSEFEWEQHIARPGERLTHGICPACIHLLYPDIASLVCGE
ncbi:hypothetical protein FTUN_0354 [Frigoriglobus tundricola]|uniref:Uncharacterized protein n=1 Tax=Frigoriglobus tundricola TaxID=2774151 RepID=A0A6M5YFR5_9BACT|nr:hypothetical protein FTUN_0354 [Frigoriglobus tundricola]